MHCRLCLLTGILVVPEERQDLLALWEEDKHKLLNMGHSEAPGKRCSAHAPEPKPRSCARWSQVARCELPWLGEGCGVRGVQGRAGCRPR